MLLLESLVILSVKNGEKKNHQEEENFGILCPERTLVVPENTLVLLVWGEYRLPTTCCWGFMERRGRAWSWPARETPSLPGMHLTKAKASSKIFLRELAPSTKLSLLLRSLSNFQWALLETLT